MSIVLMSLLTLISNLILVLSTSGNHVSPNLLKQPVSVLYRFDDHSGRLVPKVPSDLTVFPRLCQRFRLATRRDDVIFHSFFLKAFIPPQYASIGAAPFTPVADSTVVDAQPFLSALGFDSSSTTNSMNTRLYRHLCVPLPSDSSSSRLWLRFWNLPLSAPCRNIWYRLLHQKLPTRSLMARILPSRVDSPTCCICHLESEDTLHFLFHCPYKLSVWSSIWRTYFACSFSPDSLRLAYFELVFPPVCSHITHVPAAVIFSSTLLAIWRHHWKLVFDNVPFRVSPVVHLANRLIHTHIGETLIPKGISPIPIVHLNTVVPPTSRPQLLDTDILWVLFLFQYFSLYRYILLFAFRNFLSS